MDDLLIVGDDGQPLYFLDLQLIATEGGKLAVQLASIAGNPAEVDRVLQQSLARLGGGAFVHVAMSALSVISVSILGGCLDISALHGIDIRAGLQAILEAPS